MIPFTRRTPFSIEPRRQNRFHLSFQRDRAVEPGRAYSLSGIPSTTRAIGCRVHYFCNASTRIRTQNAPLEAEDDFLFTTEAMSTPNSRCAAKRSLRYASSFSFFRLCSVRSLSRIAIRKARDSNPHDLMAARFSKPARQALSGYLPRIRPKADQ